METTTNHKAFKNPNFTKRVYGVTNVVGCFGSWAPEGWVECESDELEGLANLYRQAGTTFYGWL